MIRNRIIPAFVLAGLVGVAACERQEETQIETVPPTTEAPATDPAVTEPAPMTEPMVEDTLDPAWQDDTVDPLEDDAL